MQSSSQTKSRSMFHPGSSRATSLRRPTPLGGENSSSESDSPMNAPPPPFFALFAIRGIETSVRTNRVSRTVLALPLFFGRSLAEILGSELKEIIGPRSENLFVGQPADHFGRG